MATLNSRSYGFQRLKRAIYTESYSNFGLAPARSDVLYSLVHWKRICGITDSKVKYRLITQFNIDRVIGWLGHYLAYVLIVHIMEGHCQESVNRLARAC